MKNIPQNWFPVILLLFLTTKGYTQLNAVTIGDAQSIGNNCYVITENVDWQRGGVWYDNPIDFDEDFTIYYKNNFGSTDSQGADGMALVFKRTNIFTINDALGNSGGGVGYEGVLNSLIVEFDTYQNTDKNDPWYDHLSIMINGNASHSNPNNLVGPVPPTSTTTNMEDGVDHNVKIVWAASTQTFEVFFDCELRLSLNRDIRGTIFGGDSTVFFGFVGSTGGLSNLHQVCFNSISFVDNLVLQPQTICIGESAQVDAEIPSGNTYTWSPSTGVSDVNIPNPTLSPNTTTTYTVTIEDECGEATIESVEIIVTPQNTTTFDPIDPICEGDSNPLPATDINGITGSWAPDFDATTTTDYSFTPDPGQCATTPAPVQVVVNPIVTPTFDSIDPICEGDSIAPLPTTSNNGITGTWNPATIDNTTTDVYTFTPDAGVCVIPTTIEITVLQQITPTFLIDDICIGESTAQLPVVSEENISGSWSPSTVNNLITTTYTFTPDPGQCANTTTETINVNPINTLSIATENTSAPFDSNQIIEVTVTGGSGNYEYQLDGGIWQNSPVFQNVIGCQEHIVKVRDEEGCSNEPESVVTILSYPKFFTPNGDGYNDFWNIECLKNRTGLISIFDRFGKLLKQFKTTSSGWNGSYNNTLMPTSDYWFMVRYFDENGLEKEFRSHFTLRR
ncbi:MAG: T9SS type B sorting domain-containing protein [Flavobacteriaceae bacterium]|nr:T9SS type B sorting domain-containing protein [Flavobacteriaceae bacterium]